jgi:hypothetical protein
MTSTSNKTKGLESCYGFPEFSSLPANSHVHSPPLPSPLLSQAQTKQSTAANPKPLNRQGADLRVHIPTSVANHPPLCTCISSLCLECRARWRCRLTSSDGGLTDVGWDRGHVRHAKEAGNGWSATGTRVRVRGSKGKKNCKEGGNFRLAPDKIHWRTVKRTGDKVPTQVLM